MRESARRKSIRSIIEKVVNEETHFQTEDGRVEACTVEEAYIRATAKRALDTRNRFGMEATRFLTEYQYGKPTETVKVGRAFEEDEFDAMSEEELIEVQAEILKGALSGSSTDSPGNLERYVESGERSVALQHILEARGEDTVEKMRRVTREREAARKEALAFSEESRVEVEIPEGTDDLLAKQEAIINEPWF